MPDAATAPIAEIMAARSSGAINQLQWQSNYEATVGNRLLADSGMPAKAIAAKIDPQAIPTAADQSLSHPTISEASDAKFAAINAEVYAPAKDPADYNVPISHMPSAEDLSVDTAVRQAFHAAEMPAITANTVSAAMDQVGMSLQHSELPQLQAFALSEANGLKRLWGDQFTAKIQAVDAYLDSAADRIPFVAAVLADPRARYYLTDRRVVTALSQMIEGRAGTRN